MARRGGVDCQILAALLSSWPRARRRRGRGAPSLNPPVLGRTAASSSLPQGVENLIDRLDRMAAYGPTFCDITWGAGGTTADVTLDIATKMQNEV